MVDQAMFSSFRRSGPQSSRPVPDESTGMRASQKLPIQEFPRAEPAAPTLQRVDFAQPPVLPPVAEVEAAHVDVAPVDRAELSSYGLPSDQLGLVHPDVIVLRVHLPGAPAIELDAASAGIYRPSSFRAAPWSGFAHDESRASSTGLAAGTRILTARGEVEVEKLVPGDAAMALRGPALLPIAWIGRAVAAAAPIWIEAGALAPNVPRRTLRLGPDQPVFLKEVPVAASTLVNGTTIRRVEGARVELFHVDVGRAEVIFAEGLALSSSPITNSQAL